jgi:hypothetical protein
MIEGLTPSGALKRPLAPTSGNSGSGGPSARVKIRSKLAGRVQGLAGQDGQVLRDAVPEGGAEDADVVAAAVPHAHDGLLVELVGDAQAGRDVDLVLDVAVEADAADAGHLHLAGVDVEEAGVAGLVDGLGLMSSSRMP